MSYATIISDYKTVLTGEGYTECKNLLEFIETPLSYNHKHYVLKSEGFPIEMYQTNAPVGTHKIRLEVRYQNDNTTERDANYQLFIDLVTAIAAVDDFKGDAEEPTFMDEDDRQHTIGTFVFYAGIEGC